MRYGNVRTDGLARGEYRSIPALPLGKLGLDRSRQGQHLLGMLIADVVVEVLKATQHAAARYLVVDAINEQVAQRYEHFGFHRAAEQAAGPTVRLLARIDDLRAALVP